MLVVLVEIVARGGGAGLAGCVFFIVASSLFTRSATCYQQVSCVGACVVTADYILAMS